MLGRLVRWIVRAILRRAAALTISAFVLTIVGFAATAYWRLGAAASFEHKAKILELTITGLGLLSIVLLILQLRQTAVYNHTLCYHQFFGELPSPEKVRDLWNRLQSMGLSSPTLFQPLTVMEAKNLWSSRGVSGKEEIGHRLVRAFLDDFEEMCAAINVGLLSDDYVREIEGTRTINAYFGFEQFILLVQHEHAEQALRAGAVDRNLSAIRSKAYFELRKVARRWKTHRAREHRKKELLEARMEKLKRWVAESDTDGVEKQ